MHNRFWNIGIGLLFIAASLFTLLVWIPVDIETGVIVQERRATEVGDAMAPTMAAIAILLASTALVMSAVLAPRDATAKEPDIGVSTGNLGAIGTMAVILAASLAAMIWAGPVTVGALQAAGFDVKNYRLLTDTIPYKYIGFALGGFILVAGLISWIEGHASWRAAGIAVGAVLALILVYDVPFDQLLLPPNGSQ